MEAINQSETLLINPVASHKNFKRECWLKKAFQNGLDLQLCFNGNMIHLILPFPIYLNFPTSAKKQPIPYVVFGKVYKKNEN